MKKNTCKHNNLLSIRTRCFLTETGYQPKFHEVYIVVSGAPNHFVLSKENLYFLLNSFRKLGLMHITFSRLLQLTRLINNFIVHCDDNLCAFNSGLDDLAT